MRFAHKSVVPQPASLIDFKRFMPAWLSGRGDARKRRIGAQCDQLKEEVKPVFTNGKKRKQLITINVPTRVFQDRDPCLFEVGPPFRPKDLVRSGN